MAGHSHWANIQRHKGAMDAKRGKVFSKLARYIMVAARNGGGDPTMNLRLRYAIDKARSVSMPRDNIERAVKKGTGELAGDTMEEITYEGYGPGGVAILVETLTDNRNRTGGEIRSMFDKLGGNQGTPGCVSYLFDKKGIIIIDAKKYPAEDAVMEVALNADAADFHALDEVYEISCDAVKFLGVQSALSTAGYEMLEAEIKNIPQTSVDLDVETGKKVMKLIDTLDNNDDVQNVYTNANITEEMAA